MNFAKFYILASALIGLLQIVDGIFYVLHGGEPQLFNHLFSFLETGWVLVSIAALIVFLKFVGSVLPTLEIETTTDFLI